MTLAIVLQLVGSWFSDIACFTFFTTNARILTAAIALICLCTMWYAHSSGYAQGAAAAEAQFKIAEAKATSDSFKDGLVQQQKLDRQHRGRDRYCIRHRERSGAGENHLRNTEGPRLCHH